MSGSNENKPPVVDKKLEAEVYERFSRIVKDKFSAYAEASSQGGSKVNQLDVLYKKPEFSAEKKILNDMNNNGIRKGIVATVLSFAFLRYSPGAISRQLRRRAATAPGSAGSGAVNPFNKPHGYKLDPPKGEGMPSNPINYEQPGIFFRGMRLCLDAFVSLSVGAYASVYFLDTPKMMKQASEIPLVGGRSLLSEELCRDFTSEFQKFDRRTWDENHPALGSGGNAIEEKTDFVGLIEGFVLNCRRREIYEEELRKSRGLGVDDPVIISSSGVPRDISVSLDDLIEDKQPGAEGDDAGFIEDDFFDTYFDSNDDETD